MKDQILSTTLASGLPLEINFSVGRDIVYVLLTYFPEWLKQYVLRKAYLRCSQLEAREWLMDDPAWDPDWKE